MQPLMHQMILLAFRADAAQRAVGMRQDNTACAVVCCAAR